jgi:uncharacterized protein
MFTPLIVGTESLTPQLEIKINGTSLAQSSMTATADLLSVTVTEDVETPGMFALTFINQDLIDRQITWSDYDLFDVGNEVEICMGDGENIDSLILGEITGLEVEFEQDEVPTLIVRGYDLRHRLMRGQKTRSFTKTKDSEIASQIAREAGLTAIEVGPTATVEDTKIKLDYVLQHNQTDLDFLQSRAQRIGYEVRIEGEKLFFQPAQNGKSKTLTLTYGRDVLAFSARLSSMNQNSSVEVHGWNVKEKKAIAAKSKASELKSSMGGRKTGPQTSQRAFGQSIQRIVTEPVSSASEAQEVAKGQLETMALAYITGSGECRGNPKLRAGRVIEVAGAGDRFSGLYYVTSATHTHTKDEGYQTEFEVKRNAT